MRNILLTILLVVLVGGAFTQSFYNDDDFFRVRKVLKTRDLVVTGDVTADTLGDIIDYVDDNFTSTAALDTLLGAKIGTSMVYWEFDSISVSDFKIKIIGTSTVDSLIIEIGGEQWYLPKR